MDELIKTDLKSWLNWKTDEYTHIGYVCVYVNSVKDTLVFLRHIEEKKKTRAGETTLRYSLITEIPGSFYATGLSYGDNSDYERDEITTINKTGGLFHAHHGDAQTIETFLELYLAKKGTSLKVEYWPNNNSNFLKSKDLTRETLIFSFSTSKRLYRVDIDNIPNSHFTRLYMKTNSEYMTEINKVLCAPAPAGCGMA